MTATLFGTTTSSGSGVFIELVRAARYGQVEMAELLLRRYANPDSFDPVKRRSALHAAAKHRHVPIVKMLIGAGANVELQTLDGSGMRALHFAAQSGSMESVQALLQSQADPAPANADGTIAAEGSAHPGSPDR